MFSLKGEIRHFRGVVVKTVKKCAKKCDARAKLFILLIKPIVFRFYFFLY